MAKIKKEDLNHLSNEEIREIMNMEHWSELPEPIHSYIKQAYLNDNGYIANELIRVEKLLSNIIVERFVIGEL